MKKITSVKIKYIISLILCLALGTGIYSIWSYKMNYEMIMRYTDLDESSPNFPFGQKKIDARYWISEKNFSKIDSYKICNPKITPLILDDNFDLEITIEQCLDKNKINYPILYNRYMVNKVFKNTNKEVKTIYLFSEFNVNTNSPTIDIFLIEFLEHEAIITRTTTSKNTTYHCNQIDKKGTLKSLIPSIFKKIKSINPRFPEYLNK